MKIKKILMSGFRSFKDLNPISLPDSGVLGIRGYNKDSNGSSGSGKSSIILALQFAFDCCPFPATILQSNMSDKSLQIEVEFETEKGLGIIKRGEVNSLTYNGKTIKGSIKAVQEAIRNITGLSTEFLQALCFHNQKELGFFLTMTDSQKKDFLSQLLGLNELEDKIDSANKTIKGLEEDLVKLNSTKEALIPYLVEPLLPELNTDEILKDVLKDNEVKLEELNKQENLQNKLIKQIKKEISDISEDFNNKTVDGQNEILAKYNEKKQLRVAPNPKESQQEQELNQLSIDCSERIKNTRYSKLELEKKNEEINRNINKLSGTERLKNKLIDSRIDLEQKIKVASDNRCSQCNQVWLQNKDFIEKSEKELVSINNNINECDKNIELEKQLRDTWNINKKSIDDLNSELNNLMEVQSELRSQITEEKQKRLSVVEIWKQTVAKEDAEHRDNLSSYVNERNLKLNTLIESKQAELDVADSALEEVRVHIKSAQNEVVKAKNDILLVNNKNELEKARYNNQKETYDKTNEKCQKLDLDIQQKTKDLNKETDFVGAVKAFIGSIFDEILQEIAAESNELLKKLPNVANTTIQFNSEKVTQKGKVNQEIKPVVIKNGKEVPLKSLSGGQFTAVDLSVDLGVGIVISRRTGKTPGIICLDESFEGIDNTVKENCLLMLKEVAKNRLVVVVDHSSETKELFDHYIDVQFENGVSTIRR